MKARIMIFLIVLLAAMSACAIAEGEPQPATACAHDAGWQMVDAATHKCKLCSETAEHELARQVIKATCQGVGYTMDVCRSCGYEGAQYDIQRADPNAHVWNSWTATQESTCTVQGSRSHTCSLCAKTEKETLPLAEHTWKAEIHAPDCKNDGYTVMVCTVCGAKSEKTDIVPRSAAYHKWGEFSVTTPATCETVGSQERSCTICGASHRQEIAPTGHSAKTYTKEADCEDGYTVEKCTVCGKETGRRTNVVPAVHRWGEWSVTIDATCEADGERARVCSACKKEEKAVIPSAGHNFKEGTRKPTCQTDGYTAIVCAVCGVQDGESYNIVPAGPEHHVWDEDRWEKEAEPTCTEWGLYWQGCELCEKMKKVPVMPNGHESAEIVVEAGFAQDGYKVLLCSVCSGEDGQRYDIVPAGMYSAQMQETQVSDLEISGAESAILYTAVSESGETAAVLEVRADASGVVEMDMDGEWFAAHHVARVVIIGNGVQVTALAEGKLHVEIACEQETEGLLVSVLVNQPNDGFSEETGEYRRGMYSAALSAEGETRLNGRCIGVIAPQGPGTLLIVSIAGQN